MKDKLRKIKNKRNRRIINKLAIDGLFINNLDILSSCINKKVGSGKSLVAWGVKETLLNDIEKGGRFKFKSKKDYTRKAKRSDFSPKHGISERTLSLAFKQVNLALSKIRTRQLGPHHLYFLSGTKAKRKSDGTPVSLTTALTQSGYGYVIGDIIQKGTGLGFRKEGFWVFDKPQPVIKGGDCNNQSFGDLACW